MTEFTVIGTPADRRVTMFGAACAAEGLPDPGVVSWAELLRGDPFEVRGLLRIDSPGEDPVADALLRGPGAPSRVGGGARWHANLVRGLQRLKPYESVNDPDEIAVLFDKRLCHARLRQAGVPVPPALPPVRGYTELRAEMAAAGWSRVFVKPAHGSSASGVVAVHVNPTRIKAVTSAAWHDGGWHNSLRVRSYDSEAEVARLIDALAPDGLHVEQWFPKAMQNGRNLDLRVVVIDGVPTHAVVRTSREPMTNLHLGGARGDLQAVRETTDWAEAMDVCARAAACFPGSLMVGVDLFVGSGRGRQGRGCAVGEVNAFGDLLPGLTGMAGCGAEGIDTYTAQVRAAVFRKATACAI